MNMSLCFETSSGQLKSVRNISVLIAVKKYKNFNT